jgi:hypothetical protein
VDCAPAYVSDRWEPLFEHFGNFGIRIIVRSMPALRKCDLVPFFSGVLLTVLLPMIFGSVLTVNFDPLFGRFSDDDLRYLRFRDLKCRFWPF